MSEYESHWKSVDGLEFYVRGWQPPALPKAVVALVHGLGEHIGRYAHLGEAFTQAGYVLSGFDLRGHGKSGGARGVFPPEAVVLDDIAAFLKETSARFPDKPLFLYGHSLGANLVLTYVLKRKPAIKGVIATGAPLRLAFAPPAWKLALGKMLNSIAPSLVMANGLATSELSNDPAVEPAYVHDPLVHDRISVRLSQDMLGQGVYNLEHASEFPLPLLLMHGGSDRIASPEASFEFASKMGPQCTLKIWDGMKHEIHNELGKAEVIRFTLDWLDGHLH